ncbi:glycosyltransferase family 2 protein [Oenococcus sp. UCMA 16435]|nr:glycosyltransferase family 2 protein [Oenococcus sp. UCMA 16435]MDI4583835.1 glycosyltransferase [Oenococcus sp. UCMA 14587]
MPQNKPEPLVSVIMPVYNQLDFLDQAIKSILRQSYSNLELIIIDDGSNSETQNFLSRTADSDQRVKVFHQTNAGQSVARNNGLSKAKGIYVYFMDSDDLVDTDLINQSVELSQRLKADTIIFDIGELNEKGEHILMNDGPNYQQTQLLSTQEALSLIIRYSRFVGPFNYFARKDVYTKNQILFPENMIFEDQISTPTVYSHATKIAFLAGRSMYWYRRRGSSATGEKWTKNLKQTITDLFFALDKERQIYLNFFDKKYIDNWHFHRMIRFYNFYFPLNIRRKFAKKMKNDIDSIGISTLTRREKITYRAASSTYINYFYRNFRKIKDM